MKLWKKHRAYILMRFVVIEMIKVMIMISPNPDDHLDPR
jgi:hypothetical protein